MFIKAAILGCSNEWPVLVGQRTRDSDHGYQKWSSEDESGPLFENEIPVSLSGTYAYA